MKHIQQTSNDCVLACLAMLSSKTLADLHEVYPDFNGCGITMPEIFYLLHTLKIPYISYHTAVMYSGRLYMITVPSLNTKGGHHSIIVDSREEPSRVLDPAKGLPDKLYYENLDDIVSYCDVIEIML